MVKQESFLVHAMSLNFVCLFFVLFLKDGVDLRIENFSCKQSLRPLSPGANGFTFLTTSYLMLKLMILYFNFQT